MYHFVHGNSFIPEGLLHLHPPLNIIDLPIDLLSVSYPECILL